MLSYGTFGSNRLGRGILSISSELWDEEQSVVVGSYLWLCRKGEKFREIAIVVRAVTLSPGEKQISPPQISKSLSYLLRHAALNANLTIRSDGYAALKEVMKSRDLQVGRSSTAM